MTDEVLFEVKNGLGLITLNRPKALNSLTQVMAKAILEQLTVWKDDTGIKAVAVVGAGEKAFCAGGDVVKIVKDYQAGAPDKALFFHDEYQMNVAINEFPKPYIALVDGITMGGGVGVSIPGDFWVATEKTMYAMPETGIGFFPDVGGGWFLPRLPGDVGMYLGLTGARLKKEDLYALGIASHVVDSDQVDDIIDALAVADIASNEDAKAVLDQFHSDPDVAPIAAVMDDIDECFNGFNVPDIIGALRELDTDWSKKQQSILASKSPLALAVTFEQLKRGAGQPTFRDNMIMEYRMVIRWMDKGDFHEGVRALLIDKDNTPVWTPATIAAVTEDMVDHYFTPFEKVSDELYG